MAEDRIEKAYQIRILPEGLIPTFKPGCKEATLGVDKRGYKIYKCGEKDKNCVATTYINGYGSEPVINSNLMKTCPNNLLLEERV